MVYYNGSVTVINRPPVSLSTSSVRINGVGLAHFNSTLRIKSVVGLNTGHGLRGELGSRVSTYGDVIIEGSQSQIALQTGSEFTNNSSTTTLNKGAGNTNTAQCYGIAVGVRSTYVKSKGTSFAGDLANTHDISVNGTFIDWAKILALPGAS
jgi:hypothetical protein